MNKLSKIMAPEATGFAAYNLTADPTDSEESDTNPILHLDGRAYSDASEDLLIVSPYTSRSHLLDLTLLNRAQALLPRSLTIMAPIALGYATSPSIRSFNWKAVFSLLALSGRAEGFAWKEQSFYVIIFRSQIPRSTSRSELAAFDRKAYEEAMAGNGLLKYWFGNPDAEGRNLATCGYFTGPAEYDFHSHTYTGVWRQREDAVPGSSGEGHKAAMRATIKMYTEWQVERHRLVVGDNVVDWDNIRKTE
ncbi:MAG: hypothetical protein Q9180_007498 [Flavoplaca navasiana]